MTSFSELINDTKAKSKNINELDNVELYVFNLCLMHSDEIIIANKIKTFLTNENKYIAKLIFSCGNCIYVFSNELLKIDYFKNMLECCEKNNDHFIDIIIHDCIDDYKFMFDVFMYLSTGKQIMKPSTNIYRLLKMLDMLGPIIHNKINMIQYILHPIINYNYVDHIYGYKNNTIDMINKIYVILCNNNLKPYLCKTLINILFKYITNITNDINKIFDSKVFKDIVSRNVVGQRLIVEHKKEAYYYVICNEEIFNMIIYNFQKCSDIHTWKVIEVVANINYKNNFEDYMNNNKYKLPETVFDYNFKVLDIKTQLYLIIKFNKLEYTSYIADLIFETKSTNLYNKLFDDLLFKTTKFKNYDELHTNISPISKYIHTSQHFTQIISYIPFKTKNWSKIGYVCDVVYDDENIKYIDVSINFTGNYVIDNNVSLLINKNIGDPYNIIDMKNVNIYSDNVIISNINNRTIGNHYYRFIVDGSINNKIYKSDYIYI